MKKIKVVVSQKKIQMERWIKRINELRQILIFYALNKND